MLSFPSVPGGTGVRDTALSLLTLVIAALLVIALVFVAYTMLLRLRHERRDRRWRRLVARWQEPVLLTLSNPARVADVHDQIEPQDRLHFVRFALEYARRVRGEEREVLRTLALPYLGPLTERIYSRHSEIRTRAVQTLGTLGLPRYAAEVSAALDDPSPLVAMVAARSLAQPEYVEYAPAILKRLARFDGWSRSFLASMLASIGPEGAPALRATFVDPAEEPWVRAVAADTLLRLDDFSSAPLAAQVVEIEGNRELLAAALRLLQEVGRPEDVDVVRVRCASPDFVIRSHALSALGTLGGDEDVPSLLGAMADPSPWVAIHAARALLAAGAHALVEDLADSDHPRAGLARQILAEEAVA